MQIYMGDFWLHAKSWFTEIWRTARTWGSLVFAGLGFTMIQVDEYLAAVVCWTIAGLVWASLARRTPYFAGKVLYVTTGIGFAVVMSIWTNVKRSEKAWTAFLSARPNSASTAQVSPQASAKSEQQSRGSDRTERTSTNEPMPRVGTQTLPNPLLEQNEQHKEGKPEAALRFKNAKEPSFVIFNSGTALVRDLRYNAYLFDLNTAVPDERGVTSVLRANKPVFSTSDWLKAGEGFGSYRLFVEGQKPKPMTRVFGWVTAACATCETERTYIVFLNFAKDGWYYEVPKGESHNWNFFKKLFGMSTADQMQLIDKVIPKSVRVSIQ